MRKQRIYRQGKHARNTCPPKMEEKKKKKKHYDPVWQNGLKEIKKVIAIEYSYKSFRKKSKAIKTGKKESHNSRKST